MLAGWAGELINCVGVGELVRIPVELRVHAVLLVPEREAEPCDKRDDTNVDRRQDYFETHSFSKPPNVRKDLGNAHSLKPRWAAGLVESQKMSSHLAEDPDPSTLLE